MNMKNKKDTSGAWWKEAIVYQIYPISFQNSNGDGTGDLRGIIDRLDYVKSLGIDVIWLNPIFKSPNDDNGYDVSDYCEIMDEFGTMSDFDELLGKAHDMGIKIILDLVINHYSDEHPWFMEARKSRDSKYYDYYHWWPAEKGTPAYRESYFDVDGNAWKYNKDTDSYYLHYFSVKQPDLNWENPELRQEIYKIMRFWFDKGVDGFRMDSISYISKDTDFPEVDRTMYPYIFDYCALNPTLHSHLQEMNREVLSKYDIMTVGEGSSVCKSEVSKFVDPDRNELQIMYHFGPSEIRNYTGPDAPSTGIEYSLLKFKQMFTEWDNAIGEGWPTIYLGNHDQPRMISRFGSDDHKYHVISAKMLTMFILTMRGTPFWYAWDEIGMSNIKFSRIEDYRDISTLNGYEHARKMRGNLKKFLENQKNTSRDNARTPFQWDASDNAGFTTGTPWIKVNPNYKKYNAMDESKDTESILNFFRKTIRLRKEHKALIYGQYILLDSKNIHTYSYLREYKNERYLISLNFTPKEAISRTGVNTENGEVVLKNYDDFKLKDIKGKITLRPFETVVIKL